MNFCHCRKVVESADKERSKERIERVWNRSITEQSSSTLSDPKEKPRKQLVNVRIISDDGCLLRVLIVMMLSRYFFVAPTISQVCAFDDRVLSLDMNKHVTYFILVDS